MTLANKGKIIVSQVYKTINHYFPDLLDRLRQIEDHRKRKNYELSELVTASISMFLFKEGSRNAYNSDRKEANFQKNYQRIFKMCLPHMDTVEAVFRILDEEELERLKASLISTLIEKRVFHKFKFLGKHFNISIDATGVMSFKKQHCEHCLFKTSKHGVKTYFHNVLEAKLITSNGFSISLATEWIYNEAERNYVKQDCERKAFKRLAEKIKKYFPRLPILITADGLYPYEGFFEICKQNSWEFIISFKDGNLKTIWAEINLLPDKKEHTRTTVSATKSVLKTRIYKWKNNLDYHGHSLNYIECNEIILNRKTKKKTENRFVHLSSFEINKDNSNNISIEGRMRWKIENEGFNTQKNGGYELQHKFSRVSFRATKNYYQCLQIAHLINQLSVLSISVQKLFKLDKKLTLKHIWKRLIGYMTDGDVVEQELDDLLKLPFQIRLR